MFARVWEYMKNVGLRSFKRVTYISIKLFQKTTRIQHPPWQLVSQPSRSKAFVLIFWRSRKIQRCDRLRQGGWTSRRKAWGWDPGSRLPQLPPCAWVLVLLPSSPTCTNRGKSPPDSGVSKSFVLSESRKAVYRKTCVTLFVVVVTGLRALALQSWGTAHIYSKRTDSRWFLHIGGHPCDPAPDQATELPQDPRRASQRKPPCWLLSPGIRSAHSWNSRRWSCTLCMFWMWLLFLHVPTGFFHVVLYRKPSFILVAVEYSVGWRDDVLSLRFFFFF